VTLTGASGAPRQIDVLIRHKQGLYEHLVIAECKYWDTPVDRQQVDALAITVREVGAAKGVIFSKKGFQSGAIAQAKHDHIELFQVRTLTDEEWGLPGREVEFFTHCHTVSVNNPNFENVTAVPGSEPKNSNPQVIQGVTHTKIHLDGSSVQTLEELIEKFAHKAASDSSLSAPVRFENSFEGAILSRIRVNITPPKPMTLFFNDGQVFVGTVSFDVGHKISQMRVYFDRSKNFFFAFAVDDIVSKTTTTASRRRDETTTTLAVTGERPDEVPAENSLKNGSLISYWIPGMQVFDEFASLKLGETKCIERVSADQNSHGRPGSATI
jgi:Restriction endonuclease